MSNLELEHLIVGTHGRDEQSFTKHNTDVQVGDVTLQQEISPYNSIESTKLH